MVDFLPIIAFIIILAFTVKVLKDGGERITVWRSIGVITAFFITIAIAVIIIEYGGKWITGSIKSHLIEMVVCIILAAIVILLSNTVLSKVVRKLIKSSS